MPRSNTGAGPGHVKSRYGKNELFSIIFSPGPRPGHVESRYGVLCIFYMTKARLQVHLKDPITSNLSRIKVKSSSSIFIR